MRRTGKSKHAQRERLTTHTHRSKHLALIYSHPLLHPYPPYTSHRIRDELDEASVGPSPSASAVASALPSAGSLPHAPPSQPGEEADEDGEEEEEVDDVAESSEAPTGAEDDDDEDEEEEEEGGE